MVIFWGLGTLASLIYGAKARSILFLLLGLALLAAGLGLNHRWLKAMERSARQIAGDRPYCLALPSLHRPVESTLDRSLLVANGNSSSPHMMLWVEAEAGMTSYIWSYRRKEFRQEQPLGAVRSCQPRRDFLSDLRPQRPGMHIAMGENYFVIPIVYDPKHQNDNFLSLKMPESEIPPLRSASISLHIDAARILTKEDQRQGAAQPPAMDGVVRQDGEQWFALRTYAADGALLEKFECQLQKRCRLQFSSGTLFFDLHMASIAPEEVPGVKRAFERLLDGFRE